MITRIPALSLAFSAIAFMLLPAASHAEPVKWLINKDKSSIRFVSTYGGTPIEGRFSVFDAAITFDPVTLKDSAVVATIDMSSVASEDSNAASNLPSAEFFDIKAFPKAVFSTDSFEAIRTNKTFNGKGDFIAVGTLELKGVKHPLRLPFTLTVEGDTAIMTGKATLKRLDYSVGTGQWKSTDTIADEVRVLVDIEARMP